MAKMRITIPVEVRMELAAIASGVAARASGAYRQHLTQGGVQHEGGGDVTDGHVAGVTVDRRPVPYGRLLMVLREEFSDQPEVVRRILERLASERSKAVPAQNGVGNDRTPSGQSFVISRRPRTVSPAAALRD